MSVITTWDEKKDCLKDSLKEAIRNLNIMLDSDTWGYADIAEDRIEMYEKMRMKLRKQLSKL